MNARWLATLVAVAFVVMTCGSAVAENAWIVSLADGIECSDGEGCGPPDFGAMEPPTFVHVDVGKKVITLLEPTSRRGETTPIDAVRQTSAGWLLTGIQENRSWSMVISGAYMTLSLTMDGTTWTVFGRVMPAEHAKP